MENIKTFLSCRCHAQNRFSDFYEAREVAEQNPDSKIKTPPYTFPWATNQYVPTRPVWPTYQTLNVVLDIEKKELSGSNTIKIKALQNEVSTFSVDSADLKIHGVSLNGVNVKYEVRDLAIDIILSEPLLRGVTSELKIDYTCKNPRAGLYFIAPDKEYPDRPVQVWSQGQDDDARFWFPCFDEPRIKCPVEMKVEVPANFIAISNGALVREERGGKTWTSVWKCSAPTPSYLVTLAVGRFSEIKDDWRGKPVTYYCEKGREEETKLSFGKTPKMMDLFSKLTGVDYPYEKYAQITAAEFIFGGMENLSATTQTDATLHPASMAEDFSSDDLVSHELAHQWFGDLVTCKSWGHGWLNEGWATFMEQVFKEQDLGLDETEYFRFEEFGIYESEDKNSYRRPIVSSFYSDPAEIWDRHLYQKGGLVLNMLRAHLGDEDFWQGVKQYLTLNKGGTVETIDFQRAMENSSGQSLQEFFDQWIFKGGYPELKASFEWDEKTKTAKFKLKQKQKINELTPRFHIQNKLEIFLKNGKSHTLEVDMREQEEVFTIVLPEKPDYCRFDVHNNLLKDLEWSMPTEMIKSQLEKDTDVVGKVWAMKHLAKDAGKEALEILVGRLKSDSFWAVRGEAALALGEIGSEEALNTLIAALKEESKSKVRTKICAALGKFRDERAAEVLTFALQTDASTFVRGTAASSLGKTKSPNAFDVLSKSIKTKSWNDHIASMSYSGLRWLRDDRALPLFLEGSKYGEPKYARVSCVSALGEYGLDKIAVSEYLKEALTDKFSRVRAAAVESLVRRRDPSAASKLDEVAHRANEGHFKAQAFRAAKRVRQNLEKPKELGELKETLEKVLDENRKLKDRMDKLEKVSGQISQA
jgi:aminopeptidase N